MTRLFFMRPRVDRKSARDPRTWCTRSALKAAAGARARARALAGTVATRPAAPARRPAAARGLTPGGRFRHEVAISCVGWLSCQPWCCREFAC